jgi:cytochrome c-type biogenesis protein CcmH/NrfG
LLKEHVFVYNLLDQYIFKKDVQDFLLPILFAIAAFETQRYQECLSTLTKILSCRTLPSNTAEKIKNDINFLKTQIPYLI